MIVSPKYMFPIGQCPQDAPPYYARIIAFLETYFTSTHYTLCTVSQSRKRAHNLTLFLFLHGIVRRDIRTIRSDAFRTRLPKREIKTLTQTPNANLQTAVTTLTFSTAPTCFTSRSLRPALACLNSISGTAPLHLSSSAPRTHSLRQPPTGH